MALLVAAGILVITGVILFLLRPLSQGSERAAHRHALIIVRDRLLAQLDELDAEHADQGVDNQVAGEERRRLEFELAQVLAALEKPAAAGRPPREKKRPRRLGALAASALPFFALALYLWQQQAVLTLLGVKPAARQEMAAGVPPKALEMVARLEQRLKAQPNDAQGWAQLGRSYTVLNRPADAVLAYAKAYQLAPADIAILSDYAWSLYGQQPAAPTPQVIALYKKLYQLDPTHQDALWVLGLAAHKEGKQDQALGYWEKLLASLPAGSEAEAVVRKAVTELKTGR